MTPLTANSRIKINSCNGGLKQTSYRECKGNKYKKLRGETNSAKLIKCILNYFSSSII